MSEPNSAQCTHAVRMRRACTARIQGLKACAAPPAGRSRLTAPPLRDRRHDGPVWQVAWAHPKFGTLLASCSFPQHGRDGLARSSPCGHPSLQEPTPITQGCSPWAREEILRRGRAACREEAAAAPWCLPKGRRFRRPLDRLGTTVRSSCGRSTRRASGGRCTSAASTRAPSTRSHGALWSTASAWRARPPMAG